jgi:hypothetical protein
MSKVKVNVSVSIDGFAPAPQQSLENPMRARWSHRPQPRRWMLHLATQRRNRKAERGASGPAPRSCISNKVSRRRRWSRSMGARFGRSSGVQPGEGAAEYEAGGNGCIMAKHS